MLWLVRFVLLALVLFLIYRMITFMLNPKRKLESAHEQKRFYFLDDPNNARKNFFLTYKGVLFEGEKYLGNAENAFHVVSIFICPHNIEALKEFVTEDFQYIEDKILEHYPQAVLDWKSPINEYVQKSKDSQNRFK